MKQFTTKTIDFAMTRQTHRFDRVIPAGAPIENIHVINDRFSSFDSPAMVDKAGKPVEMYASTNRIHALLSDICPVISVQS